MTLQIKLKGSPDSAYSYHSRILNVKCSSSKSFNTPTRAITGYELNTKAKLGKKEYLDSEIGVVYKPLSQKMMYSILNDGNYFSNLRAQIGKSLKMMTYFNYSFAVVQPGDNVIKYLKDNRLTISFSRLQPSLQIQNDIKIDAISLPWLDMSLSQFKDYHSGNLNSFGDNYDIIPIIDPASDHLDGILNYLVSLDGTDQLKVIGIKGRSYATHLPEYEKIWNTFGNRDVLLSVLDIERSLDNRADKSLSCLHYSEFLVGDTFSPHVPLPSPPPSSSKQASQISFFDKDSLCVTRIKELEKTDGWKEKISNAMNDSVTKEIIFNYQEADSDSSKMEILRKLSKVHEYKTSREEFIHSQEYISQYDIKSYIDQKPELKNINRSSSQSQLFQS